MAPAVSILMPFHRAVATIGAAVDSVRAQDFRDWELIAVNDSSPDGSQEIVREAAASDPRIRPMRNEGPRGIVGALSTAARIARGDWLARMDADDLCLPNRLSRQLEWTDRADVIASAVTLGDPLGDGMRRYVDWANGMLDHEEIARSRFIENPVIHPTVLMRRSVFEEAGGYREVPWAEDHDLWLRMLDGGARFVKIPEELLIWRDSPGRLTRTDSRYGEKNRQRMRAAFLARLPTVRDRGVVIAGAGPIGKSLALALLAESITVHGFHDVHPRRIGERIHGAPVAGLEAFGRVWPGAVLLAAVGQAGVREVILGLSLEAGYREGVDLWCVC